MVCVTGIVVEIASVGEMLSVRDTSEEYSTPSVLVNSSETAIVGTSEHNNVCEITVNADGTSGIKRSSGMGVGVGVGIRVGVAVGGLAVGVGSCAARIISGDTISCSV